MDVWNGENLEMILGCSTVPFSGRSLGSGGPEQGTEIFVDRVDPAENHGKMLLFFLGCKAGGFFKMRNWMTLDEFVGRYTTCIFFLCWRKTASVDLSSSSLVRGMKET